MSRFPIVDFHTHVLPKMDDGSESCSMSLEMLRQMRDSGVEIVVSTSHYYSRRESIQRFLDRRSASYQRLCEELDDTCPKILLGAETAFYFGIEETPELDALCIEGTKTLLVEMPFARWSEYELNAIASLCLDRGMNVVLAHLERFFEFQKGTDMIERMLALPVFVQINAETVLPLMSRGRWIRMFEERKAHVLGSDSHNLTTRPPNLAKARAMIQKKAGRPALNWIDASTNRLLSVPPKAKGAFF